MNRVFNYFIIPFFILFILQFYSCKKVLRIIPIYDYTDISIPGDTIVTYAYFISPKIGYAYSPIAFYETNDGGKSWDSTGVGRSKPTKKITGDYSVEISFWSDNYILTNLTTREAHEVYLEISLNEKPNDILVVDNKVYVVGNRGFIGYDYIDENSDIWIDRNYALDNNDYMIIDGTSDIIIILGENTFYAKMDITDDTWTIVTKTDLNTFQNEFISLHVLDRDNITIIEKGGKILKGRI